MASVANDASSSSSRWDFSLSQYPVLRPLYLVFSIEVMGFGILLPVQNFFMIENLGLSPVQVGMVLSGTMAAQLCGGAIWGRCSDSCGRRLVLICVLAWSGLGNMFVFFVRNFHDMFLARTIAGLSGGTSAPSVAYILDTVRPKDRSTYIGLLGGSASLGFGLGPGIAAALMASKLFSRRMVFLFSGCMGLLSGILAFFFVKESLPAEKRRPLCGSKEDDESTGGTGLPPVSDWKALNVGLVSLWTAAFAASFGQFFLYSMYAFLISDLFGYDDVEMGIILMCSSFWGVIVQAVIFPLTVRGVGPYVATGCGAIGMGTSLILLPWSTTLPLHCATLALFGLGNGHFDAGVPVLLASFASFRHLGFANGWNSASIRLGGLLSPLLGGVLYESCGSCSFLVGGASCICASLLVVLAFFCGSELPKEWEAKDEATESDPLMKPRVPQGL